MSDAPELTVWQIAQDSGLAAILGFAAEALRRAFRLGGKMTAIENEQAEQKVINAETKAALKEALAAHYDLKATLAGIPTRDEMRAMFIEFKDDMRRPRGRPP